MHPVNVVLIESITFHVTEQKLVTSLYLGNFVIQLIILYQYVIDLPLLKLQVFFSNSHHFP